MVLACHGNRHALKKRAKEHKAAEKISELMGFVDDKITSCHMQTHGCVPFDTVKAQRKFQEAHMHDMMGLCIPQSSDKAGIVHKHYDNTDLPVKAKLSHLQDSLCLVQAQNADLHQQVTLPLKAVMVSSVSSMVR